MTIGKTIDHESINIKIIKCITEWIQLILIINKNLSDKNVEKLKRWYSYCHKLEACYKWKYKKLKKVKLSLNMVSIGLTVSGSIVRGITMNPIILGCISGQGILIQASLKLIYVKL